MSAPHFVPLLCPACGSGLAGRAQDLAAFCVRCSRAFLCEGPLLRPLRTRHVRALPPRDGVPLALPFWSDGARLAPAFLSARPLTLARAATHVARSWSLGEGLGASPPLGATLSPTTLAAIARLAGLSPGEARTVDLLAVPAVSTGTRIHVPGFAFELVPDDVRLEAL